MVEDHPETVGHVGRHFVQQNQGGDPHAQAREPGGEPVPGKSRRAGHSGEDHQVHQGAARVAGDGEDPHHHQPHVGRRPHQGPQPPHPPVVPEPGHLLGQEHGEGQLHDLRRLDAGQAGYGDPGLVAGSVILTKNNQQGNEPQVESQEQPPLLRVLLNVHVGGDEVGHDADDRGRRLDHQPPGLDIRPQVVGGAGDEDDAEGRGRQADPQQDHIRFFHDIFHRAQDLGQNLHAAASLREKFPS